MAVKQHEIRMHLQNKVDPAVITFLCALAEEQQVVNRTLKEMADAINQMSDIMQTMMGVAGQMKNQVQLLQGKQLDANVNVESLGDE